ncbi:transcriptional regulator, AraC family [Russula earlei]|uniref:Transcriptional regulator, AraC family n=1 Tax=Russula earlei TaxID=71964 RepID=A0ACC0TW15_9AGAM|nr:transcriptional regulator, AraC family [Russula earlei]
MENKTRIFTITDTIKYYLSAEKEVPQHFGINKYDDSAIRDDFALLSNEGIIKKGLPVKTDHYALVLCLRGTVTKTVGSFTFQVNPGSLHMIAPRYIHSYDNASDDLLLYVVLFKKEFLEDTYTKDAVLERLLEVHPDEAPVHNLREKHFMSIKSILESMDKDYQQSDEFTLPVMKLQLMRLLYEIRRGCENCRCDSPHQLTRSYQIVHSFQKEVEENYIQKRTVQEYAAILNVSAKHLSEVVRNETGVTALHIIHRRLYREATYLLHYSGLSIKEIADRLNFDTSSHFSRFFKQMAGYNPSDLKKGGLNTVLNSGKLALAEGEYADTFA